MQRGTTGGARVAECQGASAGIAQPLLVRHDGGGQELAVGQGEVDAEPQGAGAECAGVGELCVGLGLG